jgi:hypothetical protein
VQRRFHRIARYGIARFGNSARLWRERRVKVAGPMFGVKVPSIDHWFPSSLDGRPLGTSFSIKSPLQGGGLGLGFALFLRRAGATARVAIVAAG